MDRSDYVKVQKRGQSIGEIRWLPRNFMLYGTTKTIHFWAPNFKWGISIANFADFGKLPEKVSYPQQVAVTATGLIWSRYSTVITPTTQGKTSKHQKVESLVNDLFSSSALSVVRSTPITWSTTFVPISKYFRASKS